MFVWTSVAHMALPLDEAGIGEIPNESAVLSAMTSNIGEQTGLYFFPGLGAGKNATRQEKNEAMKKMAEKIAANPSGLLMYHGPGRPFGFGKSLAIEFTTKVLQAILIGLSVSFLLELLPGWCCENAVRQSETLVRQYMISG